MSEEYQSLDPAARARYLAKLQVLGLKEDDDPFATRNDSRFEELMQWKSLEAYNCFENGHVHTVEIWPVDSTRCILRAVVNPSQRSAVKSNGQIIAAHCTCMAG